MPDGTVGPLALRLWTIGSIPAQQARGRDWAMSALRDLAIWWESDHDRELMV